MRDDTMLNFFYTAPRADPTVQHKLLIILPLSLTYGAKRSKHIQRSPDFYSTPSTQTCLCNVISKRNYFSVNENPMMISWLRSVKRTRVETEADSQADASHSQREADQMFVSYIWVYLSWDNEHIRWDPDQFCGQDHILIPTKNLWMPDLTIEEMTEQDKATPSPNLNIGHSGWVDFRNDQVVVSSCKMEVYRFPFDVQNCNISFKSIMHSDKELKLFYRKNNTELTEQSRQTMPTQYEWIFVKMRVHEKTVNHFGFNQTVIVYTITMKRRSVLYIANFLLPVLFFLCLDFASFLLSDTGGEKVGFKITVLLAVTVMQLILNDILPPSSDKIPLIAIYCIGIFTLMMLSLLETILVMYLIGKDQKYTDKTEENQKLNDNPEDKLKFCFSGIKKCIHSASAEDTVKEDQSFPKEDSSSPQTEVSLVMEKVYEELVEIRKSKSLLSSRTEDEKSGYWTKVAEKINKLFMIFYTIAVIVFLSVLFTVWNIGGI